MWIETFHRFPGKTAFENACTAMGWSKGPDGVWMTPPGIVLRIIGPIIDAPKVGPGGAPIEGDVLDARYHVNIASELEDLPTQLQASEITPNTARQTFGLPKRVARQPVTPGTIESWKAKYILNQRGLLAGVEAAVAGAPLLVQYAWRGAPVWSRDSPFLKQLATAVNLSDAQVDELFQQATLLKA